MNLKGNHQPQDNIISYQKSMNISPDSKAINSNSYHKEEEVCTKNQNSNHQTMNYDVAYEEDYHYMLRLYTSIDKPSNLRRQTIILMSCLEQFTSKQLLSNDYLWSIPSDLIELEQYLATIQVLQQQESDKFVLEKNHELFIISYQKEGMEIFVGHPIAVQIYNSRSTFMKKLEERTGVNGQNLLGEINKEILFLYRQFVLKKKEILKRLERVGERKISGFSDSTGDYVLELKNLQQKLCQLKQRRLRRKKQQQ